MDNDRDKNNKNKVSEDDSLWAFVTKDVEPLKGRNKINVPAQKTENKSTPSVKTQLNPKPDKAKITPKTTHHNLHNKADVDRATFDKFRKGQMPIEATIDLHGYNAQQAYEKVVGFMNRASGLGQRCVMVITGKGMRNNESGEREVGILKRSLPEWLEQPSLKSKILKVQQAQRFHGGSGAYYILLKRNK